MAEDFDDANETAAGGGATANALAAQIAMGASGGAAEEAREYLRKQSRLADLQIENLQKLDEFERSHLRWRRFNDQMKGAMQILIMAVGVAVVAAIATAVWDASRADGLVVDAISVPPQFVQAGMSGDVIADDLTNRIAAVRDFANEHSIAHSKDVKNERDEDIKVEIPDTGISLGEVSRYLRGWLGRERHLTGNLRSTGVGNIALTVALGGADSATFSGPAADLDKLEQQAAEHVFQSVDPSNYILYLYGKHRSDESLPAVLHLIRVADSPGMLSNGYSLFGNHARNVDGDMSRELKLLRLAAIIDPKALPPHMEMMFSAFDLGHDEEGLREARLIPCFRQDEQYAWREGRGFSDVREQAAIERDVETGDFVDGLSAPCGLCSLTEDVLRRSELAARMHDFARGRALIDQALAADGASAADVNLARYFADAAENDWRKAAIDARAYATSIVASNPKLAALIASTAALPRLATALARSGDMAGAHAEIDKTPVDCVRCETVRGEIDGRENNFGGAAWWFARAVHDAPSIPFAWTEWGAMLLHKGDYAAAIAKFTIANQRGPHFADPLEMWGEALMRQNRSDLALAKFEEADKYAPNWGRLHLKWGEALLWSGKPDEAQKQLAIAGTLNLSAAELIELDKMKATHGG
jgi:hypothetical protein